MGISSCKFLDIIVEDGRNYLVYLNFSLLNFPKVISKLVPFVLFFSFLYVIGKYELKNELIIFWNFGINKIELINFFIKFSFFNNVVSNISYSCYCSKKSRFSQILFKNIIN